MSISDDLKQAEASQMIAQQELIKDLQSSAGAEFLSKLKDFALKFGEVALKEAAPVIIHALIGI